jgi:hypothetical protein
MKVTDTPVTDVSGRRDNVVEEGKHNPEYNPVLALSKARAGDN